MPLSTSISTSEKGRMMDYLDFPTAWALSPKCEHDPACSYAVTKGAFLCDCGAIEALWTQMKREHDGVHAD